jgi:hypothetical protein
MCKKIKRFYPRNRIFAVDFSHAKLFVSLGAVHSAPGGFIDAADWLGRTRLGANSKAVFFISICETNIIPVFLQIMVLRKKNYF